MGDLETKNKNVEEKTENSLKEIREDLVNVESRVTEKLMAEIQPSLSVMKHDIQESIGVDLRRLVQEEVTLQKLREDKEKAEEASAKGDPEKTIKIQKNNKIIKSKKNEEAKEAPQDDPSSSEEEEVVVETGEPEKEKTKKLKKKKKNKKS